MTKQVYALRFKPTNMWYNPRKSKTFTEIPNTVWNKKQHVDLVLRRIRGWEEVSGRYRSLNPDEKTENYEIVKLTVTYKEVTDGD